MWQHCGRFDDHDEHPFTAVQKVVVETCVCDDRVCTCPVAEPEHPRRRPKMKLRCPGKQERSVEAEVTTAVRV